MRLLKASSYRTDAFGSASEFFASLNQFIPDCLIVDLQMPRTDGLELRISLTRSGIAITTIVNTAQDEPRIRERRIAAGAAAYLLKPVQRAELIAAIKAANEGAM